MAYPALQFRPGTDGTTLPNGAAAVYSMLVLNAGKFRIGADVVQGNAAVALELHLFTYPATSFIGKNSLIEAQLPTGTHYVAARSVPGGVQYKIWKQRVIKQIKCPPGCVPAPKASLRPARGLPPRRPVPGRAGKPGPARPFARPHPLLIDGPAVPIGLNPRLRSATFVAKVARAGDYEFTVLPPPKQGQELFFLSLLGRDGTALQASPTGRLRAQLAPGSWTVGLTVPAPFLHGPRQFRVRASSARTATPRPDLDNPPDGDGQVIVDADTTVDIAHTRPRAQLRLDVPAQARYRVTYAEVTTGIGPGGQPSAPATLSFHGDDGTVLAGPVQQGDAIEADLTPGRRWVDVAVPDFLGRTTPRRYSFRCAVVAGT